MYAYILLVAVLGSATAAPLATQSNPETNSQEAPAKGPLQIADPTASRAAPTLDEAPISTSAAELAAPAPAASGAAAPAAVADAAAPALKAGVPSPKSLSLISEIRSPLLTSVIAPIAAPILTSRQVFYPALTPLDLAAAPASYSIEQHGYRIDY